MNKLKVNCKVINLIFLSFVFCALVLFGLFSLKSQDTFLLSASEEELESDNQLDFDREEIKIDNVILSSDRNRAKAGENVNFLFEVEPYFSIETIKTIDYKIVSGKNYASVNNDGILSLYKNAKAYENISVQVIVNEKASNISTIMVEKTEVEDFEIVADKLTIREGEMAQVSVSKLLPQTASFKTVEYRIIKGNEYASIDSKTGLIKVNDQINIPKATFKVCAFTCENFVKESNVIEFEIYVPVKNMILSASDTVAKISSNEGKDIVLNAKPIGVVSNFNPVYVMDSAYSEYAYISGNILHVNKNLKEEVLIPVWAEQDGAESNILYIQVYIITEEIQLNENEDLKNVSQFLSYNFSAKTFPSYASSQEFSYSLTDENGLEIFYANISENGLLTINDEAPANSTLKLTIQNADATKIVYLNIQEYDTKIITLLSDSLPDTVYPCDVIEFYAFLDNKYKTKNHFEIEFESGDENVFENHGNYITIKDLYDLEKFGKNQLSFSVRIKSTTGLRSKSHTFTVNLPVASMQNQTIYVNRGETVYIDMFFNSMNFATNKEIKDVSNKIVNGQTIVVSKSPVAGQIKVDVPTKLEYNTMFRIPVYSEDGNKTCTITLIIDRFDASKLKFVLDDKDSSGYAVDPINTELWIGRSLKISFTYNGLPVSEYAIKRHVVCTGYLDILELTNDYIIVKALEGKGGVEISFSVSFQEKSDNNVTYEVVNKPMTLFNPADSENAVYVQTEKYDKNLVVLSSNKLDLSSLYKYNDSFDSKITKTWITSSKAYANGNTIEVVDGTTPWDGFEVVLHYQQTYNGKVLEMGQTKILAFLQTDIARTYTYKDSKNDMKVTDSATALAPYQLSPVNFQNLKKLGYTKIKMTVSVDIAEIDDGWQELYIYIDNDNNSSNGKETIFSKNNIEHGAGHKDTSWWAHKFNIEVDINKLIEKPYIVMAGKAHGYFGDTWNWGTTYITYTPSYS